MPELPEVETTKASLAPIINKKVSAVELFQPKLRWPIPQDIGNLQGKTLVKVTRRAKYLTLVFAKSTDFKSRDDLSLDNSSLIIHLGMSGSLQQFPIGTPKRKHDHLIITFTGDGAKPTQLHYHDPRRFGAVVWFNDFAEKLFSHLGAEPLTNEFQGDYLFNKIHRIDNTDGQHDPEQSKRKAVTRPIKSVIMDQEFVVGVGNIYATESLFLAKIHPSTPANKVNKSQLRVLTHHIRATLERAIEQGGSTLRDFTVSSGTTGYFQQTLNIYGKNKEPCPICKTPIDKVVITGRASTFCPSCQPLIK